MTTTIYLGDCRDIIATLNDNSIDSIVTDPPYELGFMGNKWDNTGIAYDVNLWSECLRVLKPGGHLLAFGGTRTYHRMACAIEDAGFEIRDSIHWLYGSGFPKSHNVALSIDKMNGHKNRGRAIPTASTFQASDIEQKNKLTSNPVDPYIAKSDESKQWDGWGTALKPGHEPIVMARKPLTGTVAANVLEHGTGALNIDGTRVRRVSGDVSVAGHRTATFGTQDTMSGGDGSGGWSQNNAGRWPANLVITHAADCGDDCAADCPVAELDQQSGITKDGVTVRRNGNAGKGTFPVKIAEGSSDVGYGGSGGASRFFTVTEWDDITPFLYVAKPSRSERNAGITSLEWQHTDFGGNGKPGAEFNEVTHGKAPTPAANNHPTVKPLELMRYLVRLVTPPGGTVLEPFAGSGTTLAAAILEGFNAIGCELTADYLPIINGRVSWAQEQYANKPESLFDQ